MISISDRLASISKPWPRAIRAELRQYIKHHDGDSGGTGLSGKEVRNQPYWFLLPVWLAEKYNLEKRRIISKSALEDLLWAQFCVFLSLRIKDDLYDGQGITSRLFFAADQFLAESNEIFFRYQPDTKPFWSIYNGSIRKSVLAFWEVDEMQKRRGVSFREMRWGYARVASIFKIGAAAICYIAGHPQDFRTVEKAADRLAMAGQILDDFEDMNEDLEQGRLNYAARYIMGSLKVNVDKEMKTLILADRVLHSNRINRLFGEIICYVQEARNALGPLKMDKAEKYFDEYIYRLETSRDALEKDRHRRLSGVDIR